MGIIYVGYHRANNEIEVANDIVYISGFVDGIHAFDVSDPANPVEVNLKPEES